MTSELAGPDSISKIGVAIFPGFELLDTFGPLEALFALCTDHKIDLYVVATTLDPVYSGTNNPAWNKKGSNFGVHLVPTHTYESVPDLDVLLIPGGFGVIEPEIQPTIDFVKRAYPTLKYLITVCNGAAIAALAGVLDGKRATTNKALWQKATAAGPKVNWIHRARYVADGKVWTSAGVSAGIDVTLGWIAEVYGEEKARWTANVIEYEWKNDPNWDPFSYVFAAGDFLVD